MANEVVKNPFGLTALTAAGIDQEVDVDILGDASDSKIKNIPFVIRSAMVPFAICNSAGSDQAKVISIPGLVIPSNVAMKIEVQWAAENTAGTIVSGGNTITQATAPYFLLNGGTTKYYITINGEYVGPGFNKIGGRHEYLIYNGTAEDLTAQNIYSVWSASSGYRKQRDGQISRLLPSNYFYVKKLNSNETATTDIEINEGEGDKYGHLYLAETHTSAGDYTFFEFGIFRTGYSENHVTKYPISKNGNAIVSFSYADDKVTITNLNNVSTLVKIFY